MTDLLFQFALNNVFISFILAIAAVIAGITLKRPTITYLMWLLVFLKLLTPPVVLVPALPGSWLGHTDSTAESTMEEPGDLRQAPVRDNADNGYVSTGAGSSLLDPVKPWLLGTWVTGSLAVFLLSLFRAYSFNHLLGKESKKGPDELQTAAAEIASCLGIKAIPIIYTTSANLSPLVWWIGAKVRIIFPAALIKRMDAGQIQWILSHELAHVRRRDYMVRWIEWLTCVCFWWNPVVWWARYNLRANEELCCDALVLSCMKPKPYIYGDSLLKAVEILASPARRQPAMASGINGGDLLKRRVRMIVSKNINRSKLRWLQACILLGALIVLPLGLTKAQDSEVNKPRKLKADSIEMQEMKAAIHKIEEAVEAGEISRQEAKIQLAELEQAMAQQKRNLISAELENEIARTEAGLRAVSMNHTPNHPEVIRLKKKLDQLNVQRQKIPNVKIFKATVPTGKLNVPYPSIDYAAVLKDMVADGMLSEEYVEDKLAEYENAQYERFLQALEEAVKAGKITEDEAAAMRVDYEERLEAMRTKRQLSRQ